VRPVEFVGGSEHQVGVGRGVDVLALEPLGLDAEVGLVGWNVSHARVISWRGQRAHTAALSPKITAPIC
jgi:hypothetical protein